MDDSFSFSRSRWKKESYFSPKSLSPRRRRSEALSNFINRSPAPGTSKSASAMDSLCSAMESQDVDGLAQLLFDLDEAGEEVDMNQVVPGLQMSLLHLAVGFSENDPLMVDIILRHGGDPNNKNIEHEDKLSPLHLSAMSDYDKVMKVLVNFGGDPKLRSGDGRSCYDIVRSNVEEEMLEKCFSYLFMQCRDFRKSIAVGLPTPMIRKPHTVHDSGSDGFYTCDSQLLGETNCNSVNDTGALQNTARRLFPKEYEYLMTEDESADVSSDDDDVRKKLTTIPEESSYGISPLRQLPVFATTSRTPSPAPFPSTFRGRGIASMTAPLYLLTEEDSVSMCSNTSASCINSTPPITPLPTKEELAKLQERMKQLKIPVTQSTYPVMSKFADSESRLETLMSPKHGACNFSSELKAGIEDLSLIHEWGNHKIDFLQKSGTPTGNVSKSFYNYLLLDPRIIKRANFSGDHLKARVIDSREKFEKFLLSVFYVGKAHGKRPLDHLVDAKAKFVEMQMGKKKLKNGEKIDKILEIWKLKMGVIIVSVFLHSSEREANVNEACMIDAMGLVELSNIKRGSYAGTVASGWSQKIKNQLGSFLLHKSFSVFVVSDPKSFYSEDI